MAGVLDKGKLQILQRTFEIFDTEHSGCIDIQKFSLILNTMGQVFDDMELNRLMAKYDSNRNGTVDLDGFCAIIRYFLEQDEDGTGSNTQQELKEAFRLYDREGNGYISTDTLREILKALDENLSATDLDGLIAEIDTDASGTVDFNEFMEMMTGDLDEDDLPH